MISVYNIHHSPAVWDELGRPSAEPIPPGRAAAHGAEHRLPIHSLQVHWGGCVDAFFEGGKRCPGAPRHGRQGMRVLEVLVAAREGADDAPLLAHGIAFNPIPAHLAAGRENAWATSLR